MATVSATAFSVERNHYATMGEAAFEMLRRAILSGALGPGERLLIEELMAACNMSRTPIREALAQLSHVGLVDSTPRFGARVSTLSRDELRDVFDTRLALEVGAIAAAAKDFAADDCSVAAKWLDLLCEAREEGDPAAASTAHARFHLALYRAIESRWLERLLCPLWDISERYFVTAFGKAAVRPAAERGEHGRLLAACESRNATRAAAELRNHLMGTANRIARAMDSEGLYGLSRSPFASAGDPIGLPKLR